MSNLIISLKTRVRYEGRAQVFDRRATVGADLEKLPNPVWHMTGVAPRSKFRKAANGSARRKKSTEAVPR